MTADAIDIAQGGAASVGTPRPMLAIEDLSKGFTLHAAGRRVRGCEDISLSIEAGEFVGVTGRSGSGKSTILKCIYEPARGGAHRVRLGRLRAGGPGDAR